MSEAIVYKTCLLERYPGKGGWTYVSIPEIPQDPKAPFGWVIVSGYIDDYPLEKVKLMPKGNGQLFLPVNMAIRKQIKKQAGDLVSVKLAPDHTPLKVPEEILECFKTETRAAYENFIALSEGQQKAYLDWIYQARTDQTRADRIAIMLSRILKKETFSS